MENIFFRIKMKSISHLQRNNSSIKTMHFGIPHTISVIRDWCLIPMVNLFIFFQCGLYFKSLFFWEIKIEADSFWRFLRWTRKTMTHRYKPELNVTPGNSILYVTAFFLDMSMLCSLLSLLHSPAKKIKTINAWLLERVSDRV